MIFLDTSFLYAGMAPNDRNHEVALQLRGTLGDTPLVTTNHVRGETWTLARSKLGHAAAVRILDFLDKTARMTLVHVDPDTERDATAWLRRHDERRYSFVDATSFAYMRQNELTEVLAFDGDFAAAGFVELRP